MRLEKGCKRPRDLFVVWPVREGLGVIYRNAGQLICMVVQISLETRFTLNDSSNLHHHHQFCLSVRIEQPNLVEMLFLDSLSSVCATVCYSTETMDLCFNIP